MSIYSDNEGVSFSKPPNGPLSGARIWLSGSISTNQREKAELAKHFIYEFALHVFMQGGHVVHGGQPSITRILLDAAKIHYELHGQRDRLILGISQYFESDPERIVPNRLREFAIVYETPKATGDRAREDSLTILREWMSARCDAVIVLGGKERLKHDDNEGTPHELQIALSRGLPCFLLGGFGGAISQYAEVNPDIIRRLKNGLTFEENKVLAFEANIERLLGIFHSGLERLPLVRGRGTDGASFRILALDGGGIKGAFTAAAVATWEEQSGFRAVDHFDLIAGTSTGGILALGLGMGLSGTELLEFYVKRGPIIFPVTGLARKIAHSFRHVIAPKYSQEVLLRELEEGLYKGGTPLTLNDSKCRLVIPSYHVVSGASHVFRTPHHPDLNVDRNTQCAHVALATSAAPTFFTAAKIANMVATSSYFDGGVWANSPAMAAIIEAVCFLGVPIERLDVLTVGTTEEPFTVRKNTRSGLGGWVKGKKILDLLMNVQQESSLKFAEQLVGPPKFLRVNVMTAPGSYKLDGPNEIEELADLGNRAALELKTLTQVKSRFLNGVAAGPYTFY